MVEAAWASAFSPRSAELGLLLLADLLGDGALLLLVLLALEGVSDGGLQVLDELLHVLAELVGLAGRHADGVGPVGLGEVVDVHPVVGSGREMRPARRGSRRWWSALPVPVGPAA